jgi:two-component system cell cycle response regulator
LDKWAQEHRSVLEILLDAYCIVDLDNRVVDFNTAFTELCGETYRKILKIGDFCELVKTEVCPHQCPSRQVVSSEKALRIDELSGSSKAYSTLNMIIGGVPVFDSERKIIGALITIRNVSAETELQKKYGERTQESVTDGLTQLFNKKYAETALLQSIKKAYRDQVPFSIGMIDIDHFKKVNDTHGHQAGDYVLSMVARILKAECRESDIVGRFGGEEFIVILAKSDVPGSMVFAERFRKRIESTAVLFDGKRIPVTVSMGTSSFNEVWQPGSNPERALKDLVNRADTALYFAKASGRNQVCQFETIPQTEGDKASTPNPGKK